MTAVGFMQGRLSPCVDGRIQAFPRGHWEDEIAIAGGNGFALMEWTLDHEGLRDNPLMTRDGRRRIAELTARHGVAVASVTGDCFMQAPFFKATGQRRDRLFDELRHVMDACRACGIRYLVFPLVDDGRIETDAQREQLIDSLLRLADKTPPAGPVILFESDYPPAPLRAFIDRLPTDRFGINYDIGNSAAAGFDPESEIGTYGGRILNVHIKDRRRGGATVPLGEGNADFGAVFRALRDSGYAGNFILQTARAADGGHLAVLLRYRDMVQDWLRHRP